MERCNACGKLFESHTKLTEHALSAHPSPVPVRDRIDLDDDDGGVFEAIADAAIGVIGSDILGGMGGDESVGGEVGGDFSGGGGSFDGGGASGEF